ncbi:hypothetical protein [Loktanella salsilacus]|uniref:hypothetical protein n=1 Tax=Loktanella salsilacus TaxID=195913 RepID=UPI0037362EAA
MAIILQSHGGPDRKTHPRARSDVRIEALLPADGDIGVDEAADFGFLLPPGDYPDNDLAPAQSIIWTGLAICRAFIRSNSGSVMRCWPSPGRRWTMPASPALKQACQSAR